MVSTGTMYRIEYKSETKTDWRCTATDPKGDVHSLLIPKIYGLMQVRHRFQNIWKTLGVDAPPCDFPCYDMDYLKSA